MFFYKVYGWNVRSDIELPMLVAGSEDKPVDLAISAKEISDEIKNKLIDVCFINNETEAYLRNKTCYLQVDEKGISYEIRKDEESHPEWMSAYLLGWGMSMFGLIRNEMAIHCSAVCGDKGAILICGNSGCGKSTVTAEFLSRGYRMMADDMAMVAQDETGRLMVKPAFPFQKLVRNAVIDKGYDVEELEYINETKDKFLVPYSGDFKTEPEPLYKIIMLGKFSMPDESQGVIEYEPELMDKILSCGDNLFLKSFLGKTRLTGNVGRGVFAIAQNIPLYRIIRPEGKDTTKEVVEAALRYAE